ncbi:MAG: hypothetical protein ACRDS9_06915 [Pseudonocardiaceae bacterium]
MHKQVIGVRVRWLCAVMIGLALLTSSCTAAPGPSLPGGPPPSNQVGPLPAECANGVTEPDQASAALQRARPGSIVCLSGDGLAGAELEGTTSLSSRSRSSPTARRCAA